MNKELLYRFGMICLMCILFIGCERYIEPDNVDVNSGTVTVVVSYRDSISFSPVGYLADVLSLDIYLDGGKVATLDYDNNVYVHKYTFETETPDSGYTLSVVPVIVEKHPTENVDLEYYFLDVVGGVSVIVDSDHYCDLNVSPDDYDAAIEKIRLNLTKSYVVKDGDATK